MRHVVGLPGSYLRGAVWYSDYDSSICKVIGIDHLSVCP